MFSFGGSNFNLNTSPESKKESSFGSGSGFGSSSGFGGSSPSTFSNFGFGSMDNEKNSEIEFLKKENLKLEKRLNKMEEEIVNMKSEIET
jgi:hypothetical protein